MMDKDQPGAGSPRAATEVSEIETRIAELEAELARVRGRTAPLREAETRLRSLVEQATDPVFCYECDPPFSVELPVDEQVRRLYDCVLMECNDACARAYGLESAEQATGRTLTDLFGAAPGSLDGLFAQMVRNGYRTVDGEGVEMMPDGSRRHFLNNAHAVIEDGRLMRVWGTFREITEQKLAENALRDERRLMEAALDAQRDTFFLFEPATGRAVRWNRAFREISGYSDEEIGAMPAPASYYGAEDLERASAFLETLSHAESGSIELELICKDGRRIPTEYAASVVLDSEGEPRYLISIGRDVTRRRQAEAEVRRHRERLVRFLDSATDSFHLVDADFRILEVSESALRVLSEALPSVVTRDDVIGQNLLDVYPFMRGSGSEERFREVLRTRAPAFFDDAVEHPVHGTVHMIVRAFPVGDDLGIVATDISDRKRAEEERLSLERQVQHSQKLESLGILAGGIAHDFNNLLVGVLGGAELALRQLEPGSAAGLQLENVIGAAERATELANQMLAYSGRGQFVVEPTDLSALIENMRQLVDASVPKKVQVAYDLDDELPATLVDVTQVRQIVLNLVINAAEAIGDGVGVVSISTGSVDCRRNTLDQMYLGDHAREGAFVWLKVADTGCGMDDRTRNRMFDPFFTTKSTGRGLGLAAALGIVRGHKGAIEVDSELERGSELTVLLPASDEAAVARTVFPAGLDSWRGTGTVLLIDDEEVVRSVASAMLARLGFSVLVAENGPRGIELFREQPEAIALVVLDVAMPEMSGDEVVREIRTIDGDARVLLSSGFSERDISRQFSGDSGIAGFVQKPYRLDTLKRKVREVLEMR